VLYIVEVSSFGGDLVATISNMRNWLEAHRSQPVMFRQVTDDGPMFRLEFRAKGKQRLSWVPSVAG
jgi:hypothetical protein